MEDAELMHLSVALNTLVEFNIPPDVQELLLRGDAARSIKPGALAAVIKIFVDT